MKKLVLLISSIFICTTVFSGIITEANGVGVGKLGTKPGKVKRAQHGDTVPQKKYQQQTEE